MGKGNGLDLNSGKTNVISFTGNTNTTHFVHDLEDSMIIRVTIVKDLGVMIDSRLDFNSHQPNNEPINGQSESSTTTPSSLVDLVFCVDGGCTPMKLRV